MNIGIIGLGDMGKLYAKAFAKAGAAVALADWNETGSELASAIASSM